VLLQQRQAWDRSHQVAAPAAAACIGCAVAGGGCPHHAARCRICGGPLHRIVVDEGFDTHPCCDRPVGPGSYAELERMTRMLGATPLSHSA